MLLWLLSVVSVSNLSTFRLGDLQKNWIVMITVIISSWKLWIKSVTLPRVGTECSVSNTRKS